MWIPKLGPLIDATGTNLTHPPPAAECKASGSRTQDRALCQSVLGKLTAESFYRQVTLAPLALLGELATENVFAVAVSGSETESPESYVLLLTWLQLL